MDAAARTTRTDITIAGIGGLRALAVLSVVLFHVHAAWLPGGFVGVDVFFVISGFVVAHSVHGKAQASFRDYYLWFYRRRFLRILPAILLFVLVAAFLGVLFIPAAPASKFIELTGIASIFGASNFALLWKAGDYFAASTEYNTFTHTWSLAVEEQYYLLFPFFSYAIIVRQWVSPAPRRFAIALVALASVVSLGLCAATTAAWREFAFYMLPTRFWELGLGFLLRVLGEGRLPRPGGVADRCATAGSLAAFAGLVFAFIATDPMRFPFPGALLPCIATAALVWVVWRFPAGIANRILTIRPLPFFGEISYSLYLWHWGVVVLMRWTTGIGTLPLELAALGLMFALACASYYLVERPLRYDRRVMALETPAFFGAYFAAGAAIAAICFGLYVTKPRVGLSSSNDVALWNPYSVPRLEPGACAVVKAKSGFANGERITYAPRCGGAIGAKLVVMGDSHAGAYDRMLYRVASAGRRPVELLTLGGCTLVSVNETPLVPGCATFRAAVRKHLVDELRRGDTLFLAGFYTPRFRAEWDDEIDPHRVPDTRPVRESAATIAASSDVLRGIASTGAAIILEAPKPTMPTALFRCADWFDRNSRYCAPGWAVPRAEMERRRARPLAVLERIAAASPAIRLWDPFPVLCPGAVCGGYLDGKPLYFDADHLSGYADDLLFRHFLQELAMPADAAPDPAASGIRDGAGRSAVVGPAGLEPAT